MWTYLTSLNCCMFTILPLESVGSRGIRKDAPAKINQQKCQCFYTKITQNILYINKINTIKWCTCNFKPKWFSPLLPFLISSGRFAATSSNDLSTFWTFINNKKLVIRWMDLNYDCFIGMEVIGQNWLLPWTLDLKQSRFWSFGWHALRTYICMHVYQIKEVLHLM